MNLPDRITVPYRQHCANKGNKDTIFKDGDPHPIGLEYTLGRNAQNVKVIFSFLTTYSSPKTTLTLPSHLGKNVSWGGTGGQFPAKP